MTRKPDDEKAEIINKIVEEVKKKNEPKLAKFIEEFVRQFYVNTSLEDLSSRSLPDLYGAVMSFWNFIEKRRPGEMEIRVYNPQFEEHGWQSTHTVIELILDDSPFLVDSIIAELNRQELNIHYIIHLGNLKVQRNADDVIRHIFPVGTKPANDILEEALIYIEIDRQTDPQVLNYIKNRLEAVLSDVKVAVDDWPLMKVRLQKTLSDLEISKLNYDVEEIAESKAFLRWIIDDHFTLLGCRYYALVDDKSGKPSLRATADDGLGLLRDERTKEMPLHITHESAAISVLMQSKHILTIAKTDLQSTVHRPTYMDFIGIKHFNKQGKLVGELWIIGHNTASAYNTSLDQIPLLRRKMTIVLEESGLNPKSHAGKTLLNILENMPRDDFFQANDDELLELALGILHMEERQQIRMFARRDIYGRFVSCLVFVPREHFSTDLRQNMQDILQKEFDSKEINFFVRFSDSALARIHFILRVDPNKVFESNFKEIEQKLIDVGRSWKDRLRDNLVEYFGEEKGNNLMQRYRRAFPTSYRESYTARAAVYDIKHIESVLNGKSLEMNFYQPLDEVGGNLRFKVYQLQHSIPLSDVLPILENMGLRVLSEQPHEIVFSDGKRVWINDFGMYYNHGIEIDVAEIKETFQEAFENIWLERTENDGFNKLVLKVGLSWREISVLRAYTKYFRQTGFSFSQTYIEETLVNNAKIAKDLITLFTLWFDPKLGDENKKMIRTLEESLLHDLDSVSNLDEDRILRRYMDVIKATLRTNYFQINKDGNSKNYLALKLNSRAIPELPLPRPLFEIYVYSPCMEGIHLRAGKVARGGIRWSDRREDFRTEILGLMKAQQVKNAQIVPTGAKGGFIVKCLPTDADREMILAEGIKCYRVLIHGLLDLTDNLVAGKVVPPANTVRYDDDDPYLVVAADKGTATFSNIANEISEEFNFWLGDAFASGGSTGYDHKQMGITARGAWESVKRHFNELNINIEITDFTVVGIGDMAGDVFGNGMLLSHHIKLVAAFNHQHIFIDPNPDPEISFQERKRLFNLPRSMWSDYNPEVISKGGGVFKRTDKSIRLSQEIKMLFGLDQDVIIPNDLIRAILKAPIDLLWNGGIGTFVKGTYESNADVGDRTNDNIRINASELRCKMVGEGGNLGITQTARMEYGLSGGMIYTDFIDNSAGVDCSDHEVNIKILLDMIVANGDMTVKQRNQLLEEMTNEVAQLVLSDNYHQTQAISLTAILAPKNVELHTRYIEELERLGKLNRELEFLPNRKELMERKLAGQGLTRSGIAVLLTYTKAILKQDVLNSNVPEDPALSSMLEMEFPAPLRKRFRKQMEQHSLRREIIATQLINNMVNKMGFTFVYRLNDETGAPVSAIVRAFAAASVVFGLNEIWEKIESLDNKIPIEEQYNMMFQIARVIRRATRWFLRNRRMRLDITKTIEEFTKGVHQFSEQISTLLKGGELEYYQATVSEYTKIGVPADLAQRLACTRGLFYALDIIDASNQYGFDMHDVAEMYFIVGDRLALDWVRTQVIERPVEIHWEALSREALRDDLDWQQRQLAISVLGQEGSTAKTQEAKFERWMKQYKVLIERWQYMLTELKASPALNFTIFFVATRELLDLTQTCFQSVDICVVNHAKNHNGEKGKK